MPIAAADKWEQIALLPEGRLAEVPYPVLLLALARAARSGVLHLQRQCRSARCCWSAARSTPAKTARALFLAGSEAHDSGFGGATAGA